MPSWFHGTSMGNTPESRRWAAWVARRLYNRRTSFRGYRYPRRVNLTRAVRRHRAAAAIFTLLGDHSHA